MKKIKVIMIGFGKVAAQYLNDPIMGKKFRYSTHIQGLTKNNNFDVSCVVDKNKTARNIAKKQFKIQNVFSSIDKVKNIDEYSVVIISTPPEYRLSLLKRIKNIKFLILEKPLSLSYLESKKIFNYCKKRNIVTIVNFWRRFVPQFEKLAEGKLTELIGNIQSVNIFYTDGLKNNGIHLIDFARFLVGEIKTLYEIKDSLRYKTYSLKNDKNVFFSGVFFNKVPLYGIALDSKQFRENGIEIFGTKGKLSILNDCREMFIQYLQKHRGISGFNELNYEKINFLKVDYDLAMLNLYKILFQIIKKKYKNISPISSALENEKLINKLIST